MEEFRSSGLGLDGFKLRGSGVARLRAAHWTPWHSLHLGLARLLEVRGGGPTGFGLFEGLKGLGFSRFGV